MENLLLNILFSIIIINAVMIIIAKNPVHSILFLVMVFVSTTGVLLFLGVEFIAMFFLIVYVGAITVLFLFVVMMLNIKIIELNEKLISYLPVGIFIGLIFLFEILFLININFSPIQYDSTYILTDIYSNYYLTYLNYFDIIYLTNTQQISFLLYTKYVYLVILCGLILLVAMIGAIVLTLNQSYKNKRQDFYIQTKRQIRDSVTHKY